MLPALLFFLSLQAGEGDLPVTVQCTVDTELPLDQISVSVEEKRELNEAPGDDGKLVLADLPEGDLHFLFYRQDERLGRVRISDARRGQLIRIKVRLVPGNAILLDEYRVKGIEGSISSEERTGGEQGSSSIPDSRSPPESGSVQPWCPPAGEPVLLEGEVTRRLDRESFAIEAAGHRFTIYVGSATRVRQGRTAKGAADIGEGVHLSVRGAVAAGPEGECSIGAREILLSPSRKER